jgi:UDP-N-acetyl-D-galactosamine dehydrogenase
VRNTKVVGVIEELTSFGCRVDVHDPWADADEAQHEYKIALVAKPEPHSYDAIVIAVAHREFVALGAAAIRAFGSPNTVIYDIKHVLAKGESDERL